jgi:hypothetical protein
VSCEQACRKYVKLEITTSKCIKLLKALNYMATAQKIRAAERLMDSHTRVFDWPKYSHSEYLTVGTITASFYCSNFSSSYTGECVVAVWSDGMGTAR